MSLLFVVDNIVVGLILIGCLIAVTGSLIYGTVLVCMWCIFIVKSTVYDSEKEKLFIII